MIEIASDEAGIYQKFHGKAVLELEQQGIKEERYKDMVSELRKEVRDEIYNSFNEARLNYKEVKRNARSIKDTTDRFALDDLALYGKSPGTCNICRITSN